jgi:tetratricopeptide (TPR) repeat protein
MQKIPPVDYKRQGNAHLRNNELEEAAQCYRRAVSADPSDVDACVNLGFTIAYLNRLAAHNEFHVRQLSPGHIRLNEGRPVEGHLSVWVRAERRV